MKEFNTTGFMLPLRLWLIENDLTRSWLGRKINVSPAAINYWFEGKHKPTRKNRSKIKEVTGIEL